MLMYVSLYHDLSWTAVAHTESEISDMNYGNPTARILLGPDSFRGRFHTGPSRTIRGCSVVSLRIVRSLCKL